MFFSPNSLVSVFGLILLKMLLPVQAQIDLNGVGIRQVVGEKEYFIENILKVNFHKAMQYCALLNMTLASIESATEAQNLKNILSTNSVFSKQYWLSGNDLALSQEFIWFGTGTSFSYTNWASGVRPNLSQRCVRTDGNFNWRRESCNILQYFICEKPVLPVCGPKGECTKRSYIIY